jgi:hypothetical protein
VEKNWNELEARFIYNYLFICPPPPHAFSIQVNCKFGSEGRTSVTSHPKRSSDIKNTECNKEVCRNDKCKISFLFILIEDIPLYFNTHNKTNSVRGVIKKYGECLNKENYYSKRHIAINLYRTKVTFAVTQVKV